jgi:aminoglycoside 6'-N-acetyltransferase
MVNQALLAIDVQTRFIDGEFQVYLAETMLNRIKNIIEKARLARIPVIYVQHNEDLENDGPLHPSIAPHSGDPIVLKMTPDAFHETELKQELDKLKISHLVIVGFQTDYCINTTATQAHSLGYQVTIIKDAHSTIDSESEKARSIINRYNEKFSRFSNLVYSDSLNFYL